MSETYFPEDEYFYLLRQYDEISVDEEEIIKAGNGDALTLCIIAERYFNKNDYLKALVWYRKAAAQNSRKAQCNITIMYFNGLGLAKNMKQTLEWLLIAANEDGYARAQHDLGVMYDEGKGVERNIPTAFEWYTKVANQGDDDAQYALFMIYDNYDEFKDPKKAAYWNAKYNASQNE